MEEDNKELRDLELRRPKGPKGNGAVDSFFVLGSNDVSAQGQNQHDYLDLRAIADDKSKELSSRGLLPSQSGVAQTPRIVLLTTGDILIQQPEIYKEETLKKLENWSKGKVILMANGADSDSLRIKNLGLGINENLIAVRPQGQVFASGKSFDSDFIGKLNKKYPSQNNIQNLNVINLEDSKHQVDIQLLRAVQDVLVKNGFIQKMEQGQEATEALVPTSIRDIVAQESVAVVASDKNMSALAVSPSDAAVISGKKHKERNSNEKGKPQKKGGWTNNKKTKKGRSL